MVHTTSKTEQKPLHKTAIGEIFEKVLLQKFAVPSGNLQSLL